MKWIALGIGLLVLVVGYFYFSSSYTLSREAKKEFANENFEASYYLSMQALEADPYNRSALSISSQSKQRLKIQNFYKKPNKTTSKL